MKITDERLRELGAPGRILHVYDVRDADTSAAKEVGEMARELLELREAAKRSGIVVLEDEPAGVYAASVITPEMIDEMRRENARLSAKLDALLLYPKARYASGEVPEVGDVIALHDDDIPHSIVTNADDYRHHVISKKGTRCTCDGPASIYRLLQRGPGRGPSGGAA